MTVSDSGAARGFSEGPTEEKSEFEEPVDVGWKRLGIGSDFAGTDFEKLRVAAGIPWEVFVSCVDPFGGANSDGFEKPVKLGGLTDEKMLGVSWTEPVPGPIVADN